MYIKDNDGNEIYVADGNGKIIIYDNRYAKKNDGTYYYPKDNNGKEYMLLETIGLLENNGKYVYPLDEQNEPYYPKNQSGDEVYAKGGDAWIILENKIGEKRYARKSNSDFYYPEDNTVIVNGDGIKIYAETASGDTIFPIDKDGHEFYLNILDKQQPLTIPTRYAKNKNNKEIYPQSLTTDGSQNFEVFLNNTYAKDENGEFYYPKDNYNNEYYIDAAAGGPLLTRYAVTNNGKVILAEDKSNAQYIIDVKKQPPVTKDNVLGKLVRENDTEKDYLTDVDLPNAPSVQKLRYAYRDIALNEIKDISPNLASPSLKTPFYKSWWMIIIIIVMFIIKSLVVWWFFFHTPSPYQLSSYQMK